jgi:hydrogenase expression/formation protein HypE
MKPQLLEDTVHMKHGQGGRAMRALIESVLVDAEAEAEEAFSEEARREIAAMDDGAAIRFGDRWLVITTDAHVIKPIFFPGGDIGRLAVSGVVNDLAMMGATEVLALTSSVILEEGFPIELLKRVKASMKAASREAVAPILTGDTKVMGRGEVDGLVMSTSGLGVAERVVRDAGLRAGDAIVITGTIGDHGLAVMSARHSLGLEGELRSDVAPLNGLIRAALQAGGEAIHAMKDPTRGGVTSALSEMADKANVGIVLDESTLPMSEAARAAADLLGIDPLGVANEGKAVIGVAQGALDRVLAALRSHPLGARATCIGRVNADAPGTLLLDTGFGKRRLFERDGEPLPRIC